MTKRYVPQKIRPVYTKGCRPVATVLLSHDGHPRIIYAKGIPIAEARRYVIDVATSAKRRHADPNP